MAVHSKEPAADHVRVTYRGLKVYWTPNSWHSPKGYVPGSLRWMASRVLQQYPPDAVVTIVHGEQEVVLKAQANGAHG